MERLGLVSVVRLNVLWTSVVINVKNSSCVRVGPRHKVTCAEITRDGNNLLWLNEMCYFGIFLLSVVFPLDALQITLNVDFTVRLMLSVLQVS